MRYGRDEPLGASPPLIFFYPMVILIVIIRVLQETNGVLSGADGAASRLGIKRTTWQSMLKRFRIGLEDYRRETGTSVAVSRGGEGLSQPRKSKSPPSPEKREKDGAPPNFVHFTRRLYFLSTSRRRSWGRAITV